MDKKRVLVCSAWPYASGVPHLGNLVGCLLSGDVISRYYRVRGCDVLYVSGTDAHGTRIEFEALREGVTPQELADRNHRKICSILDSFDIRFDNYTTTMTDTHRRFVRTIYLQMQENGFIFTQAEQRAYCLNDERFLADRLISGTCPKCGSPHALGNQCDACGTVLEPEELIAPKCSFCNKGDIEFRETSHWYLDLAKLSSALQSYVRSRAFQGNVHLFTQRMLDEGLRPRAMTRDIDWGIPAPFDGAEGKVIYVWGEAALGYVSATIEHFAGGDEWRKYWFGDDVHQIYTMAKDNIPFHTLIFPGQLIASGQGYHLPDQIAATEYLTWVGGDSFSKSRGVGLYCDDALRVLDGEYWRFYLLYNRPEGRDVSFSWEELDKAINGILISNVANLINRVLSFVQTKYDSVIPAAPIDTEVTDAMDAAVTDYEAAFDRTDLGQALRRVCDLAVYGNEYFQRKEPWATGDAGAVAGGAALARCLALLLAPYTPSFASRVLAILGISDPTWDELSVPLANRRITEDRVLLDRVDVDHVRNATTALRPTADRRSPANAKPRISYEDFAKLDLRVGVIREAREVEDTTKLYQLTVDLGSETRQCVAGLRESHPADELIGKSVIVLANLEPRSIRGIQSECMVLAAQGTPVALVTTDGPTDPGTPVA